MQVQRRAAVVIQRRAAGVIQRRWGMFRAARAALLQQQAVRALLKPMLEAFVVRYLFQHVVLHAHTFKVSWSTMQFYTPVG